MRDTALLKIIELLKMMDERISNIESSLEDIVVDDFYFSSYGSYMESIKEVELFILTELVKEIK